MEQDTFCRGYNPPLYGALFQRCHRAWTSCCISLRSYHRMTSCLPILFHCSPSARGGFQTLIILFFYSNGKCPSSAPMINKLNLKVDQHSTAEHRKKNIHAPKSLRMQMHQASMHLQTDRMNSSKRRVFRLLVIDHFHVAVLLNPKLTNNDIVDTTGGVCPGVGFIISAETKKQKIKTKVT